MKLYYFSQLEDPYDMYTDFTVIAKSKKEAWKLIKNKMMDAYEFMNDYSKYEIKEYPLNKPVCISHFSCG